MPHQVRALQLAHRGLLFSLLRGVYGVGESWG